MSTKSDFKMFSEMYDNIYKENDNIDSADTQSVDPGTVASIGPATGSTGEINHAASTALLSLQAELQKAGFGSDPRVIQHIQGLSSLIKPGLSTSGGQPTVLNK